MHIGDVARAADVSVPVVRRYDRAGLLCPSSRTQGGFRLYDQRDLQRLRLLRQMRLPGFTTSEMRDLVALLEESSVAPSTPAEGARELEALKSYTQRAKSTERELQAQLRSAYKLITELESAVIIRSECGHV